MDDAESLLMGYGGQADDRLGTTSFPGLGRANYVALRLQDIVSVRLIDLRPREVADRLARQLAGHASHDVPITVAFMNMRNFIAVQNSPAALTAFAAMDQVYAYGLGLQIGRRLAGLPRFSRASGTDTVPLLLQRVVPGTRVFLLGGCESVSNAAADRFHSLFPTTVLVGSCHGYFDASQDDEVLRRIEAAAPDVLLVGMGSPLQEQWVLRHRRRLGSKLVICVGGLFHYWARELRRAPAGVRELGLEWLWILVQQPFKWRIYTVDAARFAAVLMHRRRLTLP